MYEREQGLRSVLAFVDRGCSGCRGQPAGRGGAASP